MIFYSNYHCHFIKNKICILTIIVTCAKRDKGQIRVKLRKKIEITNFFKLYIKIIMFIKLTMFQEETSTLIKCGSMCHYN